MGHAPFSPATDKVVVALTGHWLVVGAGDFFNSLHIDLKCVIENPCVGGSIPRGKLL